MYEELLARLKPLGQEHLLAFWSELDEQSRRRLAHEITSVDFDELFQLASAGPLHEQWAELANRALSPAAIRLTDQSDPRRSDSAQQLGLAATSQKSSWRDYRGWRSGNAAGVRSCQRHVSDRPPLRRNTATDLAGKNSGTQSCSKGADTGLFDDQPGHALRDHRLSF